MTTAFLALTAVAAVVMAVGHLVANGLMGKDATWAHRLLLGCGGMAVLGLLLNFFVPLHAAAMLLPGAAFVGLRMAAAQYGVGLPRFGLRSAFLGFVGGAALTWFVASKAVAPPHADAGIYHFPAIAWAQQEILPLGLTNLNHRLGFNSLWLVFAAMVPPTFGGALLYAVNAALAWLTLGWFLLAARDSRSSPDQRLFAGIAAFGIASISSFHYSSPSTDLPAAIFTLFAYYFALRLTNPVQGQQETAAADRSGLLTAVVLAVTVKLSQLPLALLLTLRATEWRPGRRDGSIVALAAVLTGLWMVRGLLLSGCFAFPAPASCVDALSWAAPPELARSVSEAVHVWARAPADYSSLQGWAWLPGWIHRHGMSSMVMIAMAAGVLSSVAALWAAAQRESRSRLILAWRRLGPLLLTAWATLAFWFVQAPDPRFAYGTLIAVPALSLLFVVQTVGRSLEFRGNLLMWVLVSLMTVSCLRDLLRRPERITSPWPAATEVQSNPVATHQGVWINSAVECWHTAGLCSGDRFRPELVVTRWSGRWAFELPRTARDAID